MDNGSTGQISGITEKKRRFSVKTTFAAMRHRNYKLWFWGQMTSLMGSWMQTTAQGYLIFELTRSPVFLGYVGFATGIPSWLFMLYGGVIADRFSRRSVLVVTQIVMMILAFILAFLTFSGTVTPWSIVGLAFGLGVANAFDAPARQAFVLELIEREDLVNAVALNSTMFNSATAVGPAAAGITYAFFGPAWCFTINGLSFIGIIISLLMMRLKPQPKVERKNSPIREIWDGMLYLKGQRLILTLMGIVLVVTLLGLSFVTLVPAWAVKILHGDATTNGIMQSARGVGALISALFLASISRNEYKGKLLSAGTLAFPAILLAFSFVRWLPLSLLMLMGIGFSTILIFNLCNSLIQTNVSDAFRGRVMGVYSIVFFGFMPIGALIVGTMAEHLSEPAALIINSVILLVFGLAVYFLVPKIRRIK